METKLCHPESLRTGRGSGEMTSQTAELPSLGCDRILNKCSFLNSYTSMRYCSVRVRRSPFYHCVEPGSVLSAGKEQQKCIRQEQHLLEARITSLKKRLITDLRVSSVQCGLPSPAESSFTPESCRSLVLRSSSFRREELELRTEARASQHLSDR